MTGQQIINRALIECASEGNRLLESGQTLQAYLQDSMNLAVSDIVTRWPFEWLQTNSMTIPTVINVNQYSFPTDILEILDIVLDTGEVDTRKLKRLPLRRFKTKWAAIQYQPHDKPFEWAALNDIEFLLAPIPDSIYNMYVTGTVHPPPVTNFTVEMTAVPRRYHEGMAFGLAARGCSALREPEMGMKNLGIYEKFIQQMITEDKRQPDVEYEMQPFRAQPVMFTTAYWATPFVRGIGSG